MTVGDGFLLFGIFTITWWITLFAVLPFNIEPAKNLVKGQASGAPNNPRIKQKFLITTGIAAVISGLVFSCIKLNLIAF